MNQDPAPMTPNPMQNPSEQPTTQQPFSQQPVMPSSTVSPVTGEDPGKTLGIISIVLAFVLSIAGLIVGIIARNKSKAAGFKNTPALIGIILSIVMMVIGAIIASFMVIGIMAAAQKCDELGPGTHYEGGVTYTCS